MNNKDILGWKALITHKEAKILEERFAKSIAELDKLKSQIDAVRPIPPEKLRHILKKMHLDWNFHSNAIEGNSLTRGETETFIMHGITAKGKPFKDYKDIGGHNEAVKFLRSIVEERREIPITHHFLYSLHEMLIPEGEQKWVQAGDKKIKKPILRGKYKEVPNHVETQTGEIHTYCEPHMTHSEMSNLLEWISEYEDLHPLILYTVFHHRFVYIHPFDDGNGRMTRAISNFILMRSGFPIIVIKEGERNRYYDALREADKGNFNDFLRLVLDSMRASLDIYLRGIRGESIEDEDDFEKEIRLLEKKLADREDKVSVQYSKEIKESVWKNQLLPMLTRLQQGFQKFSRLFFDVHVCTVEYGMSEDGESILAYYLLELLEESDSILELGRKTFIYSFRLIGFKAEKNNFSMECNVFISFDKFKYRVAYMLNAPGMLREKTYDFNAYLIGMPDELEIKYGDNFSEQDVKAFEKQVLSECITLIKNAEESETEPVYVNDIDFAFEVADLVNKNEYVKDIVYEIRPEDSDVMTIYFYGDVPYTEIQDIVNHIVGEVSFLKIPLRKPQVVYQVLEDERSKTLEEEFALDDDELPPF